MRITQQMSTLSVVNNIQGNNQRKNKAYQMLTTGRKIIMEDILLMTILKHW